MNDKQVSKRSSARAATLVLMAAAAVLFVAHTAVARDIDDGTAAVRTTTMLSDGWRFRFGDDAPVEVTTPGFDDSGWGSTSVPHTWNRVGTYGLTPSPDADSRRGVGWYRLAFTAPEVPRNQRQFLQFDGVATIAEVWLNGTRVGDHRGAYTRFRFDVTDLLQPDTSNLLVVKADNSAPAPGSSTENILPLGGDYFLHGGVYRGVALIGTDSAQFDMLDHGGPGVYLSTPVVTNQRADVQVLARMRNSGVNARKLSVHNRILDADGKTVASDSAPVRLEARAAAELRRTLALPAPRLWQGRSDPYLYHVVLELREGRHIVDRVVQPLGVRTFRFDPDQGFVLNGKPTPLHGVSRHQDRAGKGWALSPQDHADDMALMLEMGVNTVRHAHYAHAQEWSDAADRAGMVVWAELPFTHESSLTHDAPNQALIDNAKTQLIETIRQNYNHPSITIWGIGNEIDIGAVVAARRNRGVGKLSKSLEMLKTLNALAQAEDGSRVTAYADCCDRTAFQLPGMEDLGGVTSINAYNRYYGWYYGAPADMGTALDELRARHPGKPIGVSEYGAGGALTQHTDNPEGGPVNSVRRPHPEEYQSWYHEQNWPLLQARPWLAATWLWNMFDFSSRREEGDAFDINDKGLVHHDHRTRKDAFWYYKAQWSGEPVLYITGRRYVDRAYPVIDVRAYSNAPQASLSVNGSAVGVAPCTGRICVWRNVQLAAGPNTVAVAATLDGKALSDTVNLIGPDPRSGLRILAGTLTGATTKDGARFGSDNFFAGGAGKSLTPFFVVDPAQQKVVSGTSTPELYAAYREGNFRYELPLPDGDWQLSLHMLEPDESKAAARTFDVAVNGKSVLRDFNPARAAGGALKATSRSFPVHVEGGMLKVGFRGNGGDAVVSAIVVSPPGPGF